MKAIRLAVSLAMLAALGGCSDPAAAPQAPGLSYTAGPGSSSDSCVTKQCNTLVSDGPMVVPAFVAAAPPEVMGGALSDGKWVLTSYTLFTGPGGQPTNIGDLNWASSVLMITGASVEEVTGSRSEDQPDTPRSGTSTVSTSGMSLTFSEACPCSGVISRQFTATPSELRLYSFPTGATIELTYTKQ